MIWNPPAGSCWKPGHWRATKASHKNDSRRPSEKEQSVIALIESSAGEASAPIYRLKVVLNETKPVIWRRLQVPGNANLGWLHAVLQVAMGWTNSHLDPFRVGELLYSDMRHNSPEFEGDPELLDEN